MVLFIAFTCGRENVITYLAVGDGDEMGLWNNWDVREAAAVLCAACPGLE